MLEDPPYSSIVARSSSLRACPASSLSAMLFKVVLSEIMLSSFPEASSSRSPNLVMPSRMLVANSAILAKNAG